MTIVVCLLHQVFERDLHQPFAFGVERAGRFVEQQDRRVAQDRAGDRDALALAARERDAAFAQEGVVALRQLVDEFGGLRGFRRGADFGFARVGTAVAHVLERAVAEDHRVLRHQREARAHVLRAMRP